MRLVLFLCENIFLFLFAVKRFLLISPGVFQFIPCCRESRGLFLKGDDAIVLSAETNHVLEIKANREIGARKRLIKRE